jgi:hypothetical protein
MGSKRAYFGTLPLWSHLRRATPGEERANPVDVVLGVDQPRALFIPASENAAGGVEVLTWGAPNQVQDDQDGWNATRSAIKLAVRARMPYGFPLVLNHDDGLDRLIDNGASDTYEFTAPHAFAVGDVLYFVRPSTATDRASLHLFGWSTVESIPDATSVVLAADPGTDDYAPEAGDLVMRAATLFHPLHLPAAPQFAQAKTGDHYSPEIAWRFVGTPTTEIHSVAADIFTLPT